MSNDADIPCYVAKCKCGCGLIFASVDEPGQSQERRKDTAKEIAELIKDGYTIERMAVAEVRNAQWKTCGNTRLTALNAPGKGRK